MEREKREARAKLGKERREKEAPVLHPRGRNKRGPEPWVENGRIRQQGEKDGNRLYAGWKRDRRAFLAHEKRSTITSNRKRKEDRRGHLKCSPA